MGCEGKGPYYCGACGERGDVGVVKQPRCPGGGGASKYQGVVKQKETTCCAGKKRGRSHIDSVGARTRYGEMRSREQAAGAMSGEDPR